MVRRVPLVLILLAGLLWVAARGAAAGEPASSRWLREVGINGGYGIGWIDSRSYEFVTVLPRVGFDLGEAISLTGLKKPPGTLELVFEPLISALTEPSLGYEAGAGLLLKYGWPLGRLIPFAEAGAGVVYVNDLGGEQSAGCNFTPQVGVGLHLLVSPNWALTAGYRFRHLSNSGLNDPNHGANTNLILVGASFLFEPAAPQGFTSGAQTGHH